MGKLKVNWFLICLEQILKTVICHFWSDTAYGHGGYRGIMVGDT